MRFSHHELFAHRHLFIVVIVIIIGLVTTSSFLQAYWLTRQRISTHYRQTFEKKTWAELEVFHQAGTAVVDSYFSKNLAAITNLATSEAVYTALERNDLQAVEELLNAQRNISQQFDTIGVLDQNGIFRISSSNQDTVKKFIGHDFSQHDYYQKTKQTKRPVVTTLFETITGREVTIFSAPVINPEGEVTHLINGTVFLPHLSDQLAISPPFDAFELVVTDHQGTVILDGRDGTQQGKNFSQQDRVIERLVRGEGVVTEEAINWQQKRVFSKGSVVDLGNDNKLFVVSSYDKAQFDRDLQSLHRFLLDIYSQLLVWIVALGIPCLLVIIVILKRHDAAAHHS